jgi:hypothetical protein
MTVFRKRFLKRLAMGLAAVALILAGALAVSPFWIPWALERLIPAGLATWESVESEGYEQWRLRDLEIHQEGLVFTVDHLDLPQPLALLRGRLAAGHDAELSAGRVGVNLLPGTGKENGAPVDLPRLLGGIHQGLIDWMEWIPVIEIGEVVVERSGQAPLSFEEIRFENGILALRFPSVDALQEAWARLELTATGFAIEAGGALGVGDLEVRSRLELAGPEKCLLEGEVLSNGTPLEFAATWTGGGLFPSGVTAEAADWPLPLVLPEWTRLAGYEPRLDFSGASEAGRYGLRVSLRADLPGSEENLARIGLSGDGDGFELEQFRITTDWLKAELSNVIRYSFVERAFRDEARLVVEGQLEKQEWIEATGRVEAELRVHPRWDAVPDAVVEARGSALSVGTWRVDSLEVSGDLDYPVLRLERVRAVPDPGSTWAASGSYDFQSREVALDTEFSITPEWLQDLGLPVRLQSLLAGEAALSGPVENLHHRGRIEPLVMEWEGMEPLEIGFDWEGRQTRSVDWRIDARSRPGAVLNAQGEFLQEDGNGPLTILLEKMHLADTAGSVPLRLEHPFETIVQRVPRPALRRVAPFRISGGDTLISGALTTDPASLEVDLRNVGPGLAADWLIEDLPPAILDSLQVEVSGWNPVVKGSFDLSLSSRHEALETLTLQLAGTAAAEGLDITGLKGEMGSVAFLSGDLILPVQFSFLAAGPGMITPVEKGRLSGNLLMRMTPEAAAQLGDFAFMDRIGTGALSLELAGTLDRPEAVFEGRIDRLELLSLWEPELTERPFRDLVLKGTLSPERLRIEEARGRVASARVEASAASDWEPLRRYLLDGGASELFPLETSRFNLRLDGVQLSEFSSLLPPFLRPQGTMRADLVLEEGIEARGTIALEEMSLRPTLYSQTIDRINLVLDLEGERGVLREASARIGESPVALEGEVDFSRPDDPLYRIGVSGRKVPLLRTSAMLLQADLDLQLARQARPEPPLLSGTVGIRDSVLLVDIDPTSPRTAGGELPRPPFFAVEAEPFSDWRLALDIQGTRGLRLRSQYAAAWLSVDFILDGTLGKPVLVGQVEAEEGSLYFPATRLSLSGATVYVTRDQPDRMQLDLSAGGMVASHVISLQVDGDLESPQVQLAATPNLSNAEIFRLLATGRLESGGLGSLGLYLGKGLLGPGGDSNGFMDRLTLEVGRDITESGRNSVDIFFDLAESWRLHGQYDKYDAQNLDLVWEVFSK